ncbi:MAG: peptide ABC transporter substrate-binding protein [Phycisphaerae bacterium]|nr:peptide ABC transporter substrate-binding protein [Phycisphaerae bacterium]
MLRFTLPILPLALAVALVVWSDRPAPRADFVFVTRGDITELDPHRASWLQDFRAIALLFEGLTANDPFDPDFRPVPAAAESWTISPDGRTYTFRLRAGARWSNGEPVTARHWVDSFRRAMLPDTGCEYVNLYQLIDGSREFYAFREAQLKTFVAREGYAFPLRAARALWDEAATKFDELVGVRALGEHELEIRLYRPTPYFLDILAYEAFAPVYTPLTDLYLRPDPATGRMNPESGWTKPGRLVCNGPFTLASWRFKREMRFERSASYWNRDRVRVSSIATPTIEDPNAQVLAFRSGAVDYLTDVGPDYKSELIRDKRAFRAEHAGPAAAARAEGLSEPDVDRALPPDPRKTIHTFPTFGTYFLNFNCSARLGDGRDNPFADARVRRAFALAVDKARITDQLRRLGEPAAGSVVPPGSIAGYAPPGGLGRDVERARALLAEAGYPGGRNFITVEILFNKEGGHDVIAQSVAKDWRETLGVSVQLVQKEIKVVRTLLRTNNFIVSRGSWYGDYADPTTFLDAHRTGDGNNDRRYSDPGFDALMDRAERETEPGARLELLRRAESILVERDLPVLPLFHYVSVAMFDPDRFRGITSHPRQKQKLYLVDRRDDGLGPDEPWRDRPALEPPDAPGPIPRHERDRP